MATMHQTTGMTGFLAAALSAIVLAGCESPSWTRSLDESFGAAEQDRPRTEEEHRREYAASHSRKSMRWLLGHGVKPGMSYEQVCRVLGVEGERDPDPALKTTGNLNVRIDDEVYSFGDSEGRTLKLFFRDDRLINFDPADFE
jgi:hypothetical protein